MGETGGNPQQHAVIVGKLHPLMLAEGGRSGADIHRYVPDAPARNAYKFSLRRGVLVMQAAQDTGRGARMVVLNEMSGKPGTLEALGVETLDKESPLIAEYLQANDLQAGNLVVLYFHIFLLYTR